MNDLTNMPVLGWKGERYRLEWRPDRDHGWTVNPEWFDSADAVRRYAEQDPATALPKTHDWRVIRETVVREVVL